MKIYVRLKATTKKRLANWMKKNLAEPHGDRLVRWTEEAVAHLDYFKSFNGNASFHIPAGCSKSKRAVTFKVTSKDWISGYAYSYYCRCHKCKNGRPSFEQT